MSYRKYSLFHPIRSLVDQAGFGRIDHVPCIFDQDWKYVRESSRYLRDRAKGLVDTGHSQHDRNILRTRLTPGSLDTIGRRHINFLEWCEYNRFREYKGQVSKSDFVWSFVSHNDLVELYAEDMLDGSWGKHALAPSTVNARVDEARIFLNWAIKVGLRSACVKRRGDQETRKSSTKPHGMVTVSSGVGRVRENPVKLKMPSQDSVERWIKCVEVESGFTKALMCRLMQQTGIRREECVQWRIDTLPEDRERWDVSIAGNFVSVNVCYGAKGPKYPDGKGGYKGPTRVINLPFKLAEEIDHYREFRRPSARRIYVNRSTSVSEQRRRIKEKESRLFLSEYSGEPISANTLYKAWKSASYLPVERWHPHLMRHFWVVSTLWNLREQAISVVKRRDRNVIVTGDWITGCARSDLITIIQPQLGHISERSTNAYLAWVRQRFDASAQHDGWVGYLSGGVEVR
ncbi:site-specific integrase [uncultured Herbaspirillum sp.]|uniref:site-specific integrase n=1 Tax=uncultured Herbaspirillum sp. TaxID=160236 RepID=UPI002587C0ED|nr:site-specific integrase [uncultured Herbaspirillum sp.]